MSNRERAFSLLPVPVYSIGRKDRHASKNSGKRRPPRNFSLTKQTVARFWGPGIKRTPEGTLSYTYYADGQVETITSSNPNGASVAYTYDDLDRLSTVVDNNLPGQNTTSYAYDMPEGPR